MINFHFIFARKHGAAEAYPVSVSFGESGLPAINAKYTEIVSNAGKDFRDSHAEILVASFSTITGYQRHEYHEFENPAQLKQRAERDARRVAQDAQAEKDAADKALADAKSRVTAAAAGLEALTPTQKAIITRASETPPAAPAASNAEDPAESSARKQETAKRKLTESAKVTEKSTRQLLKSEE